MLVEGLQIVLLQALATPVMLLPRQSQGTGGGWGELHNHGLKQHSACSKSSWVMYLEEKVSTNE